MYIELKQISSKLNKVENHKIVLVKIIEKNEDMALIEINGERFKAKVETNVPSSFFAYVEKEIIDGQVRINLKMIESLKNIKNFKTHTSELEIVKNFMVLNSIPLIEENINIAMNILKNNITLNIANFEILKYSLRKYKKNSEIIIMILQSGKSIDKDFIDLIFNLKEIFGKLDPPTLKEFSLKEFKDKQPEKHNIIENFEILTNEITGNTLNFEISLKKYKNDKILILSRIENKNGKKRYYFDLSSEKLKNFFVIIDIDTLNLNISVFLDKEITSIFYIELQNKKRELVEKLKKIFKEKKIILNFYEYKKTSIFENIFSAENKKNGPKNLDIIV